MPIDYSQYPICSTSAIGNMERKIDETTMPPPTVNTEDEFACFGRFVAMTLKKISTRSPIGALEARKEISDVLYRAELGSLTRWWEEKKRNNEKCKINI
jgi:hypothetical protein